MQKKFTQIANIPTKKAPLPQTPEQAKKLIRESLPDVAPAMEIPQDILPDSGPVAESGIAAFVNLVDESKHMAQIYHRTPTGEMGSHAEHLALGEYYSAIDELVDEFVETYAGQYGIIEGYGNVEVSDRNKLGPIQYFETVVKETIQRKSAISPEDTHLLNICDEIVAIMYRTLFKLKKTV